MSLRAFGCILVVSLCAAQAHAQCEPAAGDHAFSGDPALPCYAPEPNLPPLRLGFGALVGSTFTEGLDGPSGGITLFADVLVVGPLELGARLAYQVARDVRLDTDGDGFDDENLENPRFLVVTGGPRLVFFTEPARREGFRLGVSAGWMSRVASFGPSGPVLEVTLERQAGMLFVRSAPGEVARTGSGHDFGLALRYQQGLGDASAYRALLLALTYAVEVGVRLPEGTTPPRRKPALQYTFAGDVFAGLAIHPRTRAAYGLGLAFGLPFGRWLALQTRFEATQVTGNDLGDGATLMSAFAGLKVGRWFPFFAEVLFGRTHVDASPLPANSDPPGIASGWAVDIAVGAQLPNLFGCGMGMRVFERTRIGVDATMPTMALLGFGLTYDNLIRAGECRP